MPLPDAFVFSGAEPPAAAQFPLSQTFELQSRPLATKRIYLDFDGHVTTGTPWNQLPGVPLSLVTPAFSLDADYAAFSDLELTAIQEIWARVAEDFAPFDVDVTTRLPADEDLINFGDGDTQWGMRVVVGGDGDWMPGAAGIALLESFGRADLAPAFAFANQPWKTNFNFVATVISHEVGHTLGLKHHGYQGAEYYGGRGDWGPLMGNPFNRLLTQWSSGDYGDATRPDQDDLQIITTRPGNGFGYRPDDHGNEIGTATEYVGADITGVIERSDDVDLFRFFTASQIVAAITPASVGANLNVLAEILNSSGSVIATSNPQDSLATSFEITVTAGTYYLRVQGTGQGDPATDGYSRYGSLGQYSVSLTVDAGAPTVAIARAGSGTLIGGASDRLTFTLSLATTEFTAADITVTGGSLSGFSGSGTVYTATFTPAPAFQGSATVSVVAGAFTNGSGNPNALTTLTIPVDAVPPAITITCSGDGPLTVGSTATITFTVTEPVTTFGREDITVSGGTLSALSGTGAVYTATFIPTPGFAGPGSIAVAAGAFTDPAGYANTAASLAFAIDTVAPSVTVSRAGSGMLMVGGTAVITFQLSEPAADFGLQSVAVTGGTLTNLQLVGTLATATFVPASQFSGTATIAVPAGGFTDLAGNGNLASNTVSLSVNTLAPVITEFRASPATARLRAGDSVVLEAGLSEPVTPVGGRFTLVLDSGGRVVMAIDQSGLTARGTYTVQLGDESPDLDVVGVLVPAGLGNAVGNPLDSTLPPAASGLAARHAIIVDAGIKLVADGVFSTDPGMVFDAGSQYRRVPIRFSTPVTGVTAAAFALSLNGQPLSLAGAVLTGRSATYELRLPVSRVSPVGIYTLSIRPGSGIRAVANGAEASVLTALRWGYQRSVGMAPAAPPALAVEDVLRSELRTSVVLGWSVPAGNGGGEVTGYEVAYRLLGTSQWYDLRDPVALTATPRATISGVAAGGQYEFRVAARNAAGLGEFSVLAPFTVPVLAPPRTPVDRSGGVTLGYDADGKLLANDILIESLGGPVNYHTFVGWGWTARAAEARGGVNTLVWQNTAGELQLWELSDDWVHQTSRGDYAVGSAAFNAVEASFGMDFNGDGQVAPATTVIEQRGDVTLEYDGDGNLRADGILLNSFGSPVNYDTLRSWGWTARAADTVGGVNTVLWQNDAGQLQVWRMSSDWAHQSSEGDFTAGSPQYDTAEANFGVDVNGDGRITIESAGATTLWYDATGDLRANDNLVTSFGSPVNYDRYRGWGWEALAAESLPGVGETIVWRNLETGGLQYWRLDPLWAHELSEGDDRPGSTGYNQAETAFLTDFDRNGIVGQSFGGDPVGIESRGGVVLTRDGSGNLMANGVLVQSSGRAVNYFTYLGWGWTAVAADVVDGVNTIAWRNSAGELQLWELDGDWVHLRSRGNYAPGNGDFETARQALHIDL